MTAMQKSQMKWMSNFNACLDIDHTFQALTQAWDRASKRKQAAWQLHLAWRQALRRFQMDVEKLFERAKDQDNNGP